MVGEKAIIYYGEYVVKMFVFHVFDPTPCFKLTP